LFLFLLTVSVIPAMIQAFLAPFRSNLLHQSTILHISVSPTDMEDSLAVSGGGGCVTGVISKSGPLNEAVVAVLQTKGRKNCTLQDANEWISLGAVWAKMETLTSEEVVSQYDGDDHDARLLYADLPKGWGSADYEDAVASTTATSEEENDDLDAYVLAMEEQRFRRILTPSWMDAGTDLRIYPNPRRFPACYTMTRDQNILYEDTTFLVVDKPPMLPTQPDASNYRECCPACVADQLGPFFDITGAPVPRPLLCHRVDACVGGCVVLAKDRHGQRVFSELQRDRKLRKLYRAVTAQPVPLGRHIHWMWAGSGGPPCQLLRHTPPESRRKARTFWKRCVLEVTSCEAIALVGGEEYYENTIRLVTGRKHQVRAQLASLNCPILNDSLYAPIAGCTWEGLEDPEKERDLEARIAQCRVPTRPIGLQAAGILFGGIKVRANPPWWAANEC
jgi:23S rRNA-/tRNA-specific pseudouridylate synthase